MAQYIVDKIDAHIQIWAWKKDYIDNVIADAKNNDYEANSGLYLSVVYNSADDIYEFVPAELSAINIPDGSVPVTILNQGLNPGQTTIQANIGSSHIHGVLNVNTDDLYGAEPSFYNNAGKYYEVVVGIDTYLVPRISLNESVIPIRVRYVYKMEYHSTEDETKAYYAVAPQIGSMETVLNCFGNYGLVAGSKPYAESTIQVYDCEAGGYAEITDTGVATGLPYYIKLTTSITGITSRPSDGIRPTVVDENISMGGDDLSAEIPPLPDNLIPADIMDDNTNAWVLVDKRGEVLSGAQTNLVINPFNSWINKRYYAVMSYAGDRTLVSYVADAHGYHPLVTADGEQVFSLIYEDVAIPVVSINSGTIISLSSAHSYCPPIRSIINNMSDGEYTGITRHVQFSDVWYKTGGEWYKHDTTISNTYNTSIEVPSGGVMYDDIEYTIANILVLGEITGTPTSLRYNMDVYYSGTVDGVEYITNPVSKEIARSMIGCITIDCIVPMYDIYARWTHTVITQSIVLAPSTQEILDEWADMHTYNYLVYEAGSVTASVNPYGEANIIPNNTVRKTLGRADRITKNGGTITITITIYNTFPCVVPVNGDAIGLRVRLRDLDGSAYKEHTVYATPPPPSQISKSLR